MASARPWASAYGTLLLRKMLDQSSLIIPLASLGSVVARTASDFAPAVRISGLVSTRVDFKDCLIRAACSLMSMLLPILQQRDRHSQASTFVCIPSILLPPTVYIVVVGIVMAFLQSGINRVKDAPSILVLKVISDTSQRTSRSNDGSVKALNIFETCGRISGDCTDKVMMSMVFCAASLILTLTSETIISRITGITRGSMLNIIFLSNECEITALLNVQMRYMSVRAP